MAENAIALLLVFFVLLVISALLKRKSWNKTFSSGRHYNFIHIEEQKIH